MQIRDISYLFPYIHPQRYLNQWSFENQRPPVVKELELH